MTAIVWFRRDLRVHEHPALRAALDRCEHVVPVFCFDDRLLHGRHESGPRTQFLLECLHDLDSSLRDRGSGLLIRHGPPERELPALAEEVGATEIHFTADVTPFARNRGERAGRALTEAGVALHAHPGLTVVDAPGEVRTQKGKPQTVFTPYLQGLAG
jgi:deoxyribodipyrimidine photo-lyase